MPGSTYKNSTTPDRSSYSDLIRHLKANPSLRISSILSQMTPFYPDANLDTQLSQIDQLKTWLDSFRPLPTAVVQELKQRNIVRFTYHSNALEGNTLTQSETELVLSEGITVGGKPLIDHLEAIGHKEAIEYIGTLNQAKNPISDWEIRQIHALILRRISPIEAGRYRQLDVQTAGSGHRYPPHYLLSELMTEFIDWLSSAQSALHPVRYATEAHYRFVSIHPFSDGNGRTGRLLMNLLLLRARFPIVSIPANRRADYISALATAQQSQDDLSLLFQLITQIAHEALVEMLSAVVTAADNQSREQPFYNEVIAYLSRQDESDEIR